MQFARVLSETYRACCSSAAAQHSRPMAVIDVKLPRSRHGDVRPVLCSERASSLQIIAMCCVCCSYDINVTPDKRKALLHREQEVLDAFQEVRGSSQHLATYKAHE